jgi:hypothetical protein
VTPKPGGLFFSFYGHPTMAKMCEVSPVLRNNLVHAGFAIKHEAATGPVYCLVSTQQATEGA